MILDEPTASLDPMAEQEIFNQFDSLRKDKTTIFVSHRLSSAVIASKIIVMQNGRLIEEGNHRELMEMRGEYYTLFSTQAKRYLEGGMDYVNSPEGGEGRRDRRRGPDGERRQGPEGERRHGPDGERRPRSELREKLPGED